MRKKALPKLGMYFTFNVLLEPIGAFNYTDFKVRLSFLELQG